jgi:hypothetical protein
MQPRPSGSRVGQRSSCVGRDLPCRTETAGGMKLVRAVSAQVGSVTSVRTDRWLSLRRGLEAAHAAAGRGKATRQVSKKTATAKVRGLVIDPDPPSHDAGALQGIRRAATPDSVGWLDRRTPSVQTLTSWPVTRRRSLADCPITLVAGTRRSAWPPL